jgi:hypothetical protein
MSLLAVIKREEEKLEKELGKLQRQLNGVKAAARAMGRTAGDELNSAKKRVMSAAVRKKISRAAKKRWAKVKAGAKKAAS